MPTQALVDAQRIGKDILHATRTHAREVGERLNERLQFTVVEGETFPDFTDLQNQLARFLESALVAFEDADHAHLQELHDDREPRVRRERAVKALYDKLVEVRELAKGFFGTDLGNALVGIDGATALDPLILYDQGIGALKRLRKPDPSLPPLRLASVPFDREAVAAELQPFVDELGAILEELKREARERESTKGLRDEAQRNFDIASRAIGRIQIGLDALAGFPHFAEKIRLSLPLRGSRSPGDDEELPEESAPPPESPDPEEIQAIGFEATEGTLREQPGREPGSA